MILRFEESRRSEQFVYATLSRLDDSKHWHPCALFSLLPAEFDAVADAFSLIGVFEVVRSDAQEPHAVQAHSE